MNYEEVNNNSNTGIPLSNPKTVSLLPSTLLCSAISGIIGRVLTHPLDTIKTRFQTHHQYHSTLDVFKHTIQSSSGSVLSLYRGFGITLVLGTPGTMLYLTSYDYIKSSLHPYSDKQIHPHNQALPNWIIHLYAGFIAEAIACILYVPVDVIKERLQVQQQQYPHSTSNYNYNYRGSVHAFRTILQNEGLSHGLYKGYFATLVCFGPFSAIYFACYEYSKNIIHEVWGINQQQMHIPIHWILVCSAVSGAIASWITSPLDMAKLHMQVQVSSVIFEGNSSAIPPATVTITGNSSVTSTWSRVSQLLRRFNLLSSTTVPRTPPAHQNYQCDLSRNHSMNMIKCLQKIYTQNGWKGLYRGAGARVLYFIPLMTVTMTCYEWSQSQLS